MSQKNNKRARHQSDARSEGSHANPKAKQPSAPAPTPKRNLTWIVVVVVALLAGGIAIAGQNRGGSDAKTPQVSAEEAKYLGRLLPAGYVPLSAGAPVEYTSTVEMTELTAATADTQISVPLADLTNARLSHLRYDRADEQQLPLIAYVKPSGTLFVGISFCPPCQGEWQTIQADGTLTCNSCGTKRDLETMAGISGSCKLYPLDELPATLVDGNVVIDRAVLDSWTPQPLDRKVG